VRSINDRKIAGVCAGVADYFDLDHSWFAYCGHWRSSARGQASCSISSSGSPCRRLHGNVRDIDRVVVLAAFLLGRTLNFSTFGET